MVVILVVRRRCWTTSSSSVCSGPAALQRHWGYLPGCSRANSPLPPTPWIAARGPPTQQTLLGGCCGGPGWFGQGGGEAQGGCRLPESGADSWGSPWGVVGDLQVDPGCFYRMILWVPPSRATTAQSGGGWVAPGGPDAHGRTPRQHSVHGEIQ